MSATSFRKRAEKARAKWDAASSAFNNWAIANGFGHVRLNDIDAAIADHAEGVKLSAAEREARTLVDEVEHDAVLAGVAWRDSRGHVSFYSSADLRRFAAQRRRSG